MMYEEAVRSLHAMFLPGASMHVQPFGPDRIKFYVMVTTFSGHEVSESTVILPEQLDWNGLREKVWEVAAAALRGAFSMENLPTGTTVGQMAAMLPAALPYEAPDVDYS